MELGIVPMIIIYLSGISVSIILICIFFSIKNEIDEQKEFRRIVISAIKQSDNELYDFIIMERYKK